MYQRLLYELELPHVAATAAAALLDFPRPSTHAALRALLDSPPSAAAALAALDTYKAHEPPDLIAVLEAACGCCFSSVRQRAVTWLVTPASLPVLGQLLRTDPAWTVRQAALQSIEAAATYVPAGSSLAGEANGAGASVTPVFSEDLRHLCLFAIDDPHWRVRNDLLQVLLPWSREAPLLVETLESRFGGAGSPLVQGFLHYLRFVVSAGQVAGLLPADAPALPATAAPWWSDDPPLLRERLAALSGPSLRKALPLLLPLLTHPDAGVRRLVAKGIARYGQVDTFVWLLTQLDEPRTPYLLDMATPLLASRNEDQKEALAKHVLGWPEAPHGDAATWPAPLDSPAALDWALSQTLVDWCDELTETAGDGLVTRLLALAHRHAFGASGDPGVCVAAIKALGQVWEAPSCAAFVESAELDALIPHPNEAIGVAAWQLWRRKYADDPNLNALVPPGPRGLLWERALALDQMNRGVSLNAAEWARWGKADDPVLRALVADMLNRELAAPGDSSVGGSGDSPQTGRLQVLQEDPVAAVREAALTHARAAAIWDAPTLDAAWSVRRKAARLLKRPIARLVPPPIEEALPTLPATPARPTFPVPDVSLPTLHPAARALGGTGLHVAPLGISGHYGLPEAGYAQALDAGANLFFWEPNYNTQTRFFRALAPAYKHELVTIAGTFEAEPSAILRDLERALFSQGLEQIKLFLIYWVRDWGRLSTEVVGLLQECQAQGKIHTYGMSTHHRPFALRAIEEGWDVVMVRHNAAHRGAEEAVFPAAQAQGRGLLTFNNLIYGRILSPLAPGAPAPPSAADCYRYSLMQPGVSASFTAPYDQEQLRHNLQVLDDPHLPAERKAQMQAFGAQMYRKNRMFADCVRNR